MVLFLLGLEEIRRRPTEAIQLAYSPAAIRMALSNTGNNKAAGAPKRGARRPKADVGSAPEKHASSLDHAAASGVAHRYVRAKGKRDRSSLQLDVR